MAYVEADSYTTVARVQSLVGRGAFSSSTVPTLQMVYDFMALRAMQITARVAREGMTISVATKGNLSTTMTLADQANMYYAAGDSIFAHDVKDLGDSPDRAKALWDQGDKVMEALADTVSAGAGSVIGVKTATSTGGIAKADFTDVGTRVEVDVHELFGPKTRW